MPVPQVQGTLLEFGLLHVLAPAWLVAGFADFVCHRIMRIEHSAGVRESLLHILMLAQLGVAVLCALFFDLTALVFAIMLIACLAHEVTTCIDLAYAESRRRVPWYEQWVHALQQSFPWAWLVGWMLVGAPQALALIGVGDAVPVWEIRARDPQLSSGYLAFFFGAVAVLIGAPFAYEFWRCSRVATTANAGHVGDRAHPDLRARRFS
jgi:hypothetical protein